MRPDELTALYRSSAREVLGFLVRRTRDPQAALDLLGETFLIAFEQRDRCRARTQREQSAWLFRIAASRLIDQARRDSAQRRAYTRVVGELRAATPAELEAIEALPDAPAYAPQLRQAFEALSPEQQQAVRLRILEEQSYAQMARDIGITEDAARARVSRGIRSLRRAVPAEKEE